MARPGTFNGMADTDTGRGTDTDTDTDTATDTALVAAVELAVGGPVVRLVDVEPVALEYDPFMAGRTITRITGVAETPDGRVPWSLIVKTTAGPAAAHPYLYANAARELAAYRSGRLDDLAPSVAAPRHYRTERSPDGAIKLWLEDVASSARPVTAGDIVEAARHLGRLAGRWLNRTPADPWLFTGWLDRHAQPEAVGPALARLGDVHIPPEQRRRLGWGPEDAIALIEAQPRVRTRLERLPMTLCHHDAVGANVYRRIDGRDETVLIDWESVGPGPVGADLASLLFASARRGDIPATALPRLRPQAIRAYAAGMRDTGRPADDDMVARALDAAICLRWTLARDVLLTIVDGTPWRRGSAPAEPEQQAMTELLALAEVLFDAAGRALGAR